MLDGPGIRCVVFLSGCKLRCIYCHNPEFFKMGNMNYTASELALKILKNKEYYKNGGGVTFSGGEALLQCDFLYNVIKILKLEGMHVAIDTSGIVGFNFEKVLDVTDLLLLDVKHTSCDGFKKITGYDIDDALVFRDYLISKKFPVWIRQVIVPGIHDSIDYLKSLKNYIKDLNVLRVDFLPYSSLAISKYEELGIDYPMGDMESMDLDKCRELYSIFNSL